MTPVPGRHDLGLARCHADCRRKAVPRAGPRCWLGNARTLCVVLHLESRLWTALRMNTMDRAVAPLDPIAPYSASVPVIVRRTNLVALTGTIYPDATGMQVTGVLASPHSSARPPPRLATSRAGPPAWPRRSPVAAGSGRRCLNPVAGERHAANIACTPRTGIP
jgi:hypothetical protein